MLAEQIKTITQRLGVALTTSVLLTGAIVDARAATQGIIGTAFESSADARYCTTTSFCINYFPAIPAGKVVKIENAICNVKADSPMTESYLSPFASSSGAIVIKPVAMKVEPVYLTTMIYSYTVSLDTPLFVGAGRLPGIAVYHSAAGSIYLSSCVISGTVISG